MHKCNKGVCCNVKDCVHNENGCDCSLKKITVSKGSGEHHFCKSYANSCCCEAGEENIKETGNPHSEYNSKFEK